MNKISVVVPCFNEEDVLSVFYKKTSEVLNEIEGITYELLFVDDGSKDHTKDILRALSLKDEHCEFVSFSRNFGKEAAMFAGLKKSNGDYVVIMDADLQHPPSLLPELIDKWQKGFEVVYSVRRESCNQCFWKRKTSNLFYKIINWISGLSIPQGAADFRLLDRKAADVVVRFSEKVLFLRGLIHWMGFRQCGVAYVPSKRFSGTSHYTFAKMMALALSGLFSFGVKPLRVATFLGIITTFSGLFYGIYALYQKLFNSMTIQGWTSLLVCMLLVGGVQLSILGIIGEYIGMIFLETKRRPNYIIRESSFSARD